MKILYRCRPYGAEGFGSYAYYIDAEEIPKQINPTGLKSGFEGSKVSTQSPVRLGNRTYRAWLIAKLTLMVRFPNRTDAECISNYRIYYKLHEVCGMKMSPYFWASLSAWHKLEVCATKSAWHKLEVCATKSAWHKLEVCGTKMSKL